METNENVLINKVEDFNIGNTIKSGDQTLLKYKILDGDGEILDLAGSPCRAVVKKHGREVYSTTDVTIAADNVAQFRITEVLPADEKKPYMVEFIINEDDKPQIFPSKDTIELYILSSSILEEKAIIQSAGCKTAEEIILKKANPILDGIDEAEATRRTSEDTRVTNELAREQSEEDRKFEEMLRQLSEADRGYGESTRVAAESNRKATFDELVDTGVLQTNINTKLSNLEQTYAPKLAELDNNEDARKTAESARETNEAERILNEDGRVAAENERQTNYNELVDTGIMQENINQKLSESEQTYAPRLTNLEQNDANLTAQLAHTAYVAIKPNGVDDTDAIQAKVDELDSRGGGTLIIPRGVYWINASKHGVGRNKKHGVKLPSNIRIEMKNAVLKVIPNNDENSSVFFLDNVENTQIVGGVIEGDKFDHLGTTGEWGHGLNIQGVDTKNILIEKLQVKNCWGDGIYIRDVFGGNIVFDGITVEDCRRHEMAIIGGQDIKIIHSKMTKSSDIKDNVINTSYGGLNIDIEPHNGERSWTKDISIDGCTFDNKINTCVRFDDSYVNENVRVSNSLFYNQGLQGGNGSNYIINNNKIVPSSDPLHIDHGIRLRFVENGVINNNIIEGVNWGISTEYSGKDISISNNTIKNCKSNGILVRGDADTENITRDYTIDDNSITNCGFDGIRESYRNSLGVIGYSENKIYNIKISNNRISESPYGGIYIRYVDKLSITNNNIENFQVKIEDDVNRLANNLVRVTGSNTISFNSNMLVLSKQPQNARTPTRFSSCDNVTVVGNKCVKKEGIVRSSILHFYDTTNSFVTSNDFYESHDGGTYYHGPPTLSSNNRLNDGTLEVSGS